ncbi:MAG TPA: DUF2089 domain-containing protein [Anaerolineales bacterium]
MKPSLNKCPVCGEDLIVSRYHCEACDTVIEGRFENSAFPGLTAEQIEFVRTFVRCEGRINRIEQEQRWGSYPTIRNRLREVVRAMGYEPGKEELIEPPDDKRRSVLDDLNTGKISAQDAMRRLRGEEE